MCNVIITGADGFIGSHLTKHLSENGCCVYALIVPGSTARSRIDGCENVRVIECDLSGYDKVAEQLPKNAAAFFHLGWSGVPTEFRDDFSRQMSNVELSLDAVRLAAAVHAEKFIFLGSTLEYIYYGKPLNEDAIPSPYNAYGTAKIAARYACSVLCEKLGVGYIYAVVSSIYSEDRNDGNVIYYTVTKLLERERPSLTGLEQLWDYVHIDDVTDALLHIMHKGKPGAFYAVGHGDNWALSNYIFMIRDMIDPSLPLGIGDVPYKNPNKMMCSCVDLTAVMKDTGFVPKIPFDVGIRRVIDAMNRRV